MTIVETEIRRAIAEINSRARKHPLAFLTESDVQAQLYAALLPVCGDVARVVQAAAWGAGETHKLKPVFSSPLHSELLLPEGRIDLAILDLSATRFTFSPKGHFSHAQLDDAGAHIFIEIKVSRTHRSSLGGRSRWLNLLRADLAKLSRYSWRTFLLAYDFDIGLSKSEVVDLRAYCGPSTRLVYLNSKSRSFFVTR
jgi:hypothetical protein